MTAERHVMTIRLTPDRYEWLRRQAYERHTPMQQILDQAIDLLMAAERLPASLAGAKAGRLRVPGRTGRMAGVTADA